MYMTIVFLIASLYLFFVSFMISATGFRLIFIYKVLSFLIGVACLIAFLGRLGWLNITW